MLPPAPNDLWDQSSDSRARPLVRLRQPLCSLLFATALSGGFYLTRLGWTHTSTLLGFFGNLLLAWVPLVLSLFIHWKQGRPGTWRPAVGVACVLWFLFYPNSFYIVTDLIHFRKFGSDGVDKWFDILYFSSVSLGGVFLGCLSLYLMQLLVWQRYGHRVGWAFAIGMQALGAVGIYVGRFWRLNSWDFLQPLHLWEKIVSHHKPMDPLVAFPFAMFLFSLMAYWFVVSMVRLHETEGLPGEPH